MLYLQHNRSTSLRVLASVLNSKLNELKTIYNNSEFTRFLNKESKVAIVENSLKDNLEATLKSLSSGDDILPKIIIAYSNDVDFSNSPLANQNSNVIELINKDDPDDIEYLKGSWFEFETEVQFIIISRTDSTLVELALELKRILTTELRRVKYSLRVLSDEAPDEFWECENFGSIDLKFEQTKFESQNDDEHSVKVSYLTGIVNEEYFNLETDGKLVKMDIDGVAE